MYKRKRNFKTEKPFYILDVIAGIAVLAVLIAAVAMLTRPEGGTVEVYVDGKLEYSYPINENRTFEVRGGEGFNIVEIRDGGVSVIDADCKNGLCVKSVAISKNGQQIVCLPNRMIIVVRGGDEDEVDAKT